MATTLPTVSPPPFHERRPLARRQFRIKREAEYPSTSLVRLGSHVISHPLATSGPVNMLGPYLVYLPQITIGLAPKERSLIPSRGSKKYWTGDYHPTILRDLSDLVPIEVLTARQRVNTTAVVAAATALIFAYEGRRIPANVDTPFLKEMVKQLEKHIPRKFFAGKDGTRMEVFLRGLRRYLLHLRLKDVIHLDDDDDDDDHVRLNGFDTPMIKVEDTENIPLDGHFDFNSLEHPSAPPRSQHISAPPRSRKRGLDEAEDRPTKRVRPGQALSPRHQNFLSNSYHPNTETDGMRQLLELAGLGPADVDRCLRLMAQGMSAKRAMAELGKGMRLPV